MGPTRRSASLAAASLSLRALDPSHTHADTHIHTYTHTHAHSAARLLFLLLLLLLLLLPLLLLHAGCWTSTTTLRQAMATATATATGAAIGRRRSAHTTRGPRARRSSSRCARHPAPGRAQTQSPALGRSRAEAAPMRLRWASRVVERAARRRLEKAWLLHHTEQESGTLRAHVQAARAHRVTPFPRSQPAAWDCDAQPRPSDDLWQSNTAAEPPHDEPCPHAPMPPTHPCGYRGAEALASLGQALCFWRRTLESSAPCPARGVCCRRASTVTACQCFLTLGSHRHLGVCLYIHTYIHT